MCRLVSDYLMSRKDAPRLHEDVIPNMVFYEHKQASNLELAVPSSASDAAGAGRDAPNVPSSTPIDDLVPKSLEAQATPGLQKLGSLQGSY